MKTEKFIKSLLSPASSGRTSGIIALVAGLAAGAVLGILFAPEGGKSARKKLRDTAGRLFAASEPGDQQPEEIHPHHPAGSKRPKSDIKRLIHEAHEQAHTDAVHPE